MRGRGNCAGFAAGIVLAAGILAPAGAVASFATTNTGDMRFLSGAGEANDVTVSVVGPDIVIDDPGSTITALAGCTSVTANRVTCATASVDGRISVSTGDLGDQVVLEPSIPAFPESMNVDTDSGIDAVTNLTAHPLRASGGSENDTLNGGSGSDDLSGGDGDDTLTGNDGRDRIAPGAGIDTISGGAGGDSFDAGSTPDLADTFDGGPGRDAVSYDSRAAPVTVILDGAANDGATGENDRVGVDVEDVETGRGADLVTGNESDNLIATAAGNDTVSGIGGDDDLGGGGGVDNLTGGAGDDQVRGDDGADSVDGGDGSDSLAFEFSDRDPDQIRGGPGQDSYRDGAELGARIDLDGVADDGYDDPTEGPANDNVGADIEDLFLQGFAGDVLIGNGSSNQIDGAMGNDRISGLGGADSLIGGPGGDNLDGGAGIDSLDGDGGNDSLRSRDGSPDEVDCGSATDTLLADSLDDFALTCDSSSTGPRLQGSGARLKKGKAKLEVACPATEAIACKVSISAAKGKKVFAKGSGTVKSGATSTVTVKLTKAGKKSRSKKLALKAKTAMTDVTGARVTTSQSLTLKR